MFGIKKLKAEIGYLRAEIQMVREDSESGHGEQWELLRQVHTGVNSNIGALADRLNVHIRTRVICTTCESCGCLVDVAKAHTHVTMGDTDVVLTHYCKRCAGEMQKKAAPKAKVVK